MDSIIQTFHVEWKLLIAQAINFLIVFFVLYYFLIKPIQNTAEKRNSEIKKGLSDAKDYKVLLEKSEVDYQDKMAIARKEISQMTADLKKQAESEKSEIINEAKSKSKEIIHKTENEMKEKKDQIISEARKEIAELVVNLSEKLMLEKLTADKNESLVDKISKQI